METQAGDVLVTVAQAFGQACGTVEIMRVDRRRHFESGGFIVDVVARVIVNGHQCHSAIAVQARIELVEQVHLIAFVCQGFLHPAGDVQVDVRFGQRDVTGAIAANRPGVVARVPGHDSNP